MDHREEGSLDSRGSQYTFNRDLKVVVKLLLAAWDAARHAAVSLGGLAVPRRLERGH
jgi:hypothetical protein